MMLPSTLSSKVSYKKAPGLLDFTDTHLQFTQNGKNAPSLRLPHTSLSNLMTSKEGSAQIRLKVVYTGDDNGHMFTFTSAQALADREKFKQELTKVMTGNRANESAAPTPASVPATPTPTTPAYSLPRPQPPSRAVSVSSDKRAATPVIIGNDPAADFRMRKTVLMKNPELLALHRELVMSGQITEAEFWEGREHLLLTQAASEKQQKGKSGQLVDPRPETVDGEMKIRITPQLVHDIFDEYPVVAKAYSDNVPGKLSEEQFWLRYFQSKLFNSHQASIRSSAAQHVVKDDPIFDKYLEKDDDGIEPRRQRNKNVDRLVDLGATNEDHGEAWNEKDITMQPGRQRGALPLIRKFNEHSERLLNTSLGEGPSAKRRKLNSDEVVYTQIDLEDLHDTDMSTGIQLDMQDRQRYFEGRTIAGETPETVTSLADAIQAVKFDTREWSANLSQLKIERKAGDAALISMTKNVSSRSDVKNKKNTIPEPLLRQLTTCQTAANEFLRQFWSAVFPQQSGDGKTASAATPAQREAKAAKMIGYIMKTPEKAEALIVTAPKYGADQESVRLALKPVLDAVGRAIQFNQNRKPLK